MVLSQSDLWGVVNGTNIDPWTTNLVAQVAWKFRDLKTRFDLILHCGDHQIQLIKSLKTFQQIWAKLKSTYEHKDSASCQDSCRLLFFLERIQLSHCSVLACACKNIAHVLQQKTLKPWLFMPSSLICSLEKLHFISHCPASELSCLLHIQESFLPSPCIDNGNCGCKNHRTSLIFAGFSFDVSNCLLSRRRQQLVWRRTFVFLSTTMANDLKKDF
jgi:hypothetical protein